MPTAVPDLDEQMLGMKRNSEHVDVTEGEESQPAAKGRSGVGRTGVRRHKWAEKEEDRPWGKQTCQQPVTQRRGHRHGGVGGHGQRGDGGTQGDTDEGLGDI